MMRGVYRLDEFRMHHVFVRLWLILVLCFAVQAKIASPDYWTRMSGPDWEAGVERVR